MYKTVASFVMHIQIIIIITMIIIVTMIIVIIIIIIIIIIIKTSRYPRNFGNNGASVSELKH